MSFVPFIRCTHSGVYADGRPNTSSVLITDVDYTGQAQQNRKSPVYVPAGGEIDIAYTSDAAFSFDQGDIRKFVEAGLIEAELIGAVPPIGTNQFYYEDDPGSLGSGTRAQSYPVLLPRGTVGMLSAVWVRQDFPAAAGETATLRLYRYRKTSPTGSFFVDQITDTFVLDSTDPWSWTIDISANIRPGYDLNPITDGIAVSNVYVAGGTPTMRALRLDFRVEVVDTTSMVLAAATPTAGPLAWPV
jgi:hypothetical protein